MTCLHPQSCTQIHIYIFQYTIFPRRCFNNNNSNLRESVWKCVNHTSFAICFQIFIFFLFFVFFLSSSCVFGIWNLSFLLSCFHSVSLALFIRLCICEIQREMPPAWIKQLNQLYAIYTCIGQAAGIQKTKYMAWGWSAILFLQHHYDWSSLLSLSQLFSVYGIAWICFVFVCFGLKAWGQFQVASISYNQFPHISYVHIIAPFFFCRLCRLFGESVSLFCP